MPSRTISSASGSRTGNTATSPSSNGAELSPVGLGVNVQSEPRLVVGQPAIVTDFAEGQPAGRRNGVAGAAGLVNRADLARVQRARIQRHFVNHSVERFVISRAPDVADADGRILRRLQIRPTG